MEAWGGPGSAGEQWAAAPGCCERARGLWPLLHLDGMNSAVSSSGWFKQPPPLSRLAPPSRQGRAAAERFFQLAPVFIPNRNSAFPLERRMLIFNHFAEHTNVDVIL